MVDNTDIAAAILAGGKSTRMGRDKAGLLLPNGKTMLQHMEDILRQAGCSEIYISHPEHIADKIPALGPLSGIHAILRKIAQQSEYSKYVLFVPVDMPALTALLLRKLISAPPDAALVRFTAHKMPFRLRVNEEIHNLAVDMLNTGSGTSLTAFQKKITAIGRVCDIPSDDLPQADNNNNCNPFINVNTTGQWQEYKESLLHDRG